MLVSDNRTGSKDALRKFLQDVQKEFEHSLPALNMQPKFKPRTVTLGDSGPAVTFTVAFVPYAELRALRGQGGVGYSKHPHRTLLQTQHNDIERGRDLQQVVCDGQKGKTKQCLHVSQLWAVIVDEGKYALLFHII
jgi:hypothetical protein